MQTKLKNKAANKNQTPNNFKQTDIGLIPEDWDVKKINDAYHFTKKPRNLIIDENSEVPFIPMEIIPDNRIFVEDFNLKSFYSFSSGTYFENGDILLAKITPSFENGKQAIAKIPYDFGYATTEVIPIKEINNTSSKHFLFNYLRKIDVRKTLAGKMEGSTGRQRLPKTVLQNTLIPLPPLPEQKKIAHVLSKIQQAIETQEQIIKTTKELKKALMQNLFTEGLNGEPQKQTEIGLIPESWEKVQLGSFVKILNGYAFKSEDYVKKGVPLIRISNVSFGYLISKDDKYLPISYVDKYSDFSLKEGDLILSLTRPITSGGMKYCFIEKRHLPALLNQRVGRFKIIDDGLSKDFLYHIIFSKYFIGELQKLFGSSSQQPNVSPSQLESFKIPLPPRSEQVEITNSLDAINYKIQYSKQSISFLRSLFISTLNKLMTGQIRVKDIDFDLDKVPSPEGI